MAQSSILGGTAAPSRPRGTGTDVLGPSDSSDSGSDVQGEHALTTEADDGGSGAVTADLDSDTDASGTGERGSAVGTDPREGSDILPDRIVRTSDALDDAEPLDVDELVLDDDPQDDPDAPDGVRH